MSTLEYLSGLSPTVIGIILYLIFSAIASNRKKQLKQAKKTIGEKPEDKKRNSRNIFSTLKDELTGSLEDYVNEIKSKKPAESNFYQDQQKVVTEVSIETEAQEESDGFYEKEKQFYEKYSKAATISSDRISINRSPVLKSILKKNPVKQGIIWSEILGNPVSLKNPGSGK